MLNSISEKADPRSTRIVVRGARYTSASKHNDSLSMGSEFGFKFFEWCDQRQFSPERPLPAGLIVASRRWIGVAL
jgi:hypothetical protein